MSKTQSMVIAAGALAALLLYMAKGSLQSFFPGFVAIFFIVAIGFAIPYVSLIILIPACLLLYMGNYKKLGDVWNSISNVQIKEA